MDAKEPIAWKHNDNHTVISSQQKDDLMNHTGGAGKLIAADYMIPLYAALPSDAAQAPSIPAAIHYPDCWDDAAYPTLESALSEVYAAFKCSECGVEWRPSPAGAAPEYREGAEHSQVLADLAAGEFKPVFPELQAAHPDERAALVALIDEHKAHDGTVDSFELADSLIARATASQATKGDDHYQQLLGVAYVVLGCLAANGVDIHERFLDAFSDPDSVENPLELLPCDFSPARAVRAAVEGAQTDERAAFERHWYDFYHAGSIRARSDGRYMQPVVQHAWEAWQARAAIGVE